MNVNKTVSNNASPKMANRFTTDKKELEKYLKVFCQKIVQVIVQSRLGEKIQTFGNPRSLSNDWFNLTINDEPGVLAETKKVIDTKPGESIATRFPLCVEISLRTVDGDKMILEVWSLSCNKQQADNSTKISHAVYNRMGILLKSLILVTRSTPAYKLSRKQSTESYKIFYNIYTGNPSTHNLGDGLKEHVIGDLSSSLGQFKMSVAYRTKMTISPTQAGRDNGLMLKSDHFNEISPKPTRYHIKKPEKRVIDLEKPLTAGAFVDPSKITQYTEKDYILPETPPFSWLIRNSKNDENNVPADVNELARNNTNGQQEVVLNNKNNNIDETNGVKVIASSPGSEKSRLFTKVLPPEDDRILKEMNFPFATATPMKDLAKFYRDCFNAPPLHSFVRQAPTLNCDAVSTAAAEEILEGDAEIDNLSQQLEQFETSLGEYESLVTSLCTQTLTDNNSNS